MRSTLQSVRQCYFNLPTPPQAHLATTAPSPLHGPGRLGARDPQPQDAEEDERGLPRRKAATTIDTATAEEDVKDFDVPGEKSDRV